VNALHRVHAALQPDSPVVDTQPVSAHPPVDAAGEDLGALDMRAWAQTIEEIDQLTFEVVDAGLFAVEQEREIVVTDSYDTGPEFLETVGNWQGTRIPPALAERLEAVPAPVSVDQTVRLRVLRAL
jgi:hypothetical protein